MADFRKRGLPGDGEIARLGGFAAALVWLAWPSGAGAQAVADELLDLNPLSIARSCNDTSAPDEIVVCARRDDQERYRLPLRDERGPVYGRGPIRGEVPRASAEPIVSGGCGIFEGQRRCSRAEMAEYGYLQGRDPITFVINVVEAMADPD